MLLISATIHLKKKSLFLTFKDILSGNLTHDYQNNKTHEYFLCESFKYIDLIYVFFFLMFCLQTDYVTNMTFTEDYQQSPNSRTHYFTSHTSDPDDGTEIQLTHITSNPTNRRNHSPFLLPPLEKNTSQLT